MVSRYLFGRTPRAVVIRALLLLYVVWETAYCILLGLHQSVAFYTLAPLRNTKRIYIAAQHYNSANLLRSDWNPALLALVQELGVDNVFVSIAESGSWDDTKGTLSELDHELGVLGVKRTITLSNMTHADALNNPYQREQGWIETGYGGRFLRRIPFLASIRDDVNDPLHTLTKQGEHFDTILFLGDVVFSADDVLRLLDTNGGEYAAACSMDFAEPPRFFDTFALRDYEGRSVVMQTWPYFRSSVSRYAVERFLPVPVASCWNGIVAMAIEPFTIDWPRHWPLSFRGIDDSLATLHVEASEGCLIHADNSLSPSKGVFLNPNVKVGYSRESYQLANSPAMAMGHLKIFYSIWQNRLLRWFTSTLFRDMKMRKKLREWNRRTGRQEYAQFCLVDEMHVITEKGWRDVPLNETRTPLYNGDG